MRIIDGLKDARPNGYLESIRKGSAGVSRFRGGVYYGSGDQAADIARLREEINTADAIIIGAGAGLSTSAGFTYSGERFDRYFFDFARKFGITDMYSGGFYPFPDAETHWAWWARHIYFNRYIDAPKPVYKELLDLVRNKDYFVITTNVDHQFQRAGFDKSRLFYTQGDYGLFQSVRASNQKTYDNEEWVMKAMEAQGFIRDENGVFCVPEDGKLLMRIPSDLIPKCPDDGNDVTTNLRADMSFVEDTDDLIFDVLEDSHEIIEGEEYAIYYINEQYNINQPNNLPHLILTYTNTFNGETYTSSITIKKKTLTYDFFFSFNPNSIVRTKTIS